MKCHYIYTEEGKRVLIPGCMPVVISGDIRDCICHGGTYRQFEKQEYNQHVAELRQEIEELNNVNENLRAEISLLKEQLKIEIHGRSPQINIK